MRSVSAIVFSVLLGLASCSKEDRSPNTEKPRTVLQREPWSSDPDPFHRLSATRQGRTITLSPQKDISFTIPEEWLRWHLEFGDNIHLSPPQLKAVALGSGDWGPVFSSICNIVLPYDRCAAVVGQRGIDMVGSHMRVYSVDYSPEEVQRRVLRLGVPECRRFVGYDPDSQLSLTNQWHRARLSFGMTHEDYIGSAVVEFYSRRVAGRTLVFVILQVGRSDSRFVNSILDSVTVAPQRNGPGKR